MCILIYFFSSIFIFQQKYPTKKPSVSQNGQVKCDNQGTDLTIPVNGELVRKLIEQDFGSIDELAIEWEERVVSGRQRVGRARDRSTIYRWIDRGLPSKQNDVFGFASVLGVDPLAILKIDGQYIQKNFGRERRSFQLGLVNRTPLSPFWPIYFPSPEWPNQEIAHNFYGRPWFIQDFMHDASATPSAYAAVYLSLQNTGHTMAPKIYHFAYRRRNARDGMWRPYGTVIGYQDSVSLVSENGDYQSLSDERSNKLIVAETHFGPGSAEFRIAALHDFCVQINVPSEERVAVRFVA